MIEYLKRDISRIVGESIRKVQFWTDRGLIVPDVVKPKGKGISRVYSQRNLIEFAMIQVMKNLCSMPLGTIETILRGLRAGKSDRVEFHDFYTNGDWGHTKELVYIDPVPGFGSGRFSIVETNGFADRTPMPLLPPASAADSMIFTTVMLGKVKNTALGNIGLRFPDSL